MKKNVFIEIGGYDEDLVNSWQDVDLGIRIIQSGKLIVYTPFSVLYHYEGQTRGSKDSSDAELDARRIFREKHKEFIKKGDPYYNPNFSLNNPFKIIKNYSKPVRALAELYERRTDLQENFPNEQKNNFRSMIDWAATHGLISDNEKEILQPHSEYYFEKCSASAKPLAEKMNLFIHNKNLQKKFPEVYNGHFEKFLKHEKTVDAKPVTN